MFDVAVVGSANLDLVVRSPRFPEPGETLLGSTFAEHPGGKGLNQAVAASRCGSRVAMIGAVGDDDAGRRLRGLAASEGLAIERFTEVEGATTGRAMITVDDAGENTIIVVAGANDLVRLDDVPAASVVVAQLEVPMPVVIEAFEAARRNGARTMLDPAPAQPLSDELLAVCDIVVPNEHELAMIGGSAALLDRGVSTVITTLGAGGVDVSDVEGNRWLQGAFGVETVDTTGAGDAFCGALAARIAAGDDLAEAVRFAAAAAALATTRPGAVPSLPHAAEIDALLRTSR